MKHAGFEIIALILVWLLGVAAGAGPAAAQSATPQPTAATLEFVWASTGGPETLSTPYGLGIDPAGHLWIADGDHDQFQILAPDGTYRERWGASGTGDGQFDFATTFGGAPTAYGDVAFAADGGFYVADTGNHRVQQFVADRSFQRVWGSDGDGHGQFRKPSSIAVGPDGSVYVGDEGRGDVQRFTAGGQFVNTIGRPGTKPGEFALPAGITVDAENTLWVVDWSLHRVQRFRPDGELLAHWGMVGISDGKLNSPNDVVIDAAGRVYVWDDRNRRIQVFTAEGQFLAKVQGYGSDVGEFLSGAGLALGADGTLYVSDMERDDVQAFRLVLADNDA